MTTPTPAIARTTDPATSHQATGRVDTRLHEYLVLHVHAHATTPLTDQQLETIMRESYRIDSSSPRSRRAALTRAGLIEKAGVTNPPSGRSRIRWRITPAGRTEYLSRRGRLGAA